MRHLRRLRSLGDMEERAREHTSVERKRLRRLAEALRSLGSETTDRVLGLVVPGRIEVLGKHTDYAGGRSLVAATAQGIALLAAGRDDRRLRMVDLARDERLDVEIGARPESADLRWSLYPRTVARRLRRDFGGELLGADVVFESDLPPSAGLSSSSALVVAVFLVLAAVNQLYARVSFKGAIDGAEELADYLGAVESGRRFGSLGSDRGVGTRGGSQDHTAILCARPGEVRQYHYRPTRFERALPWPEGFVFAIADSGVRARKTGAAQAHYNRLERLVACIVEEWRAATGRQEATLAAILERGARAGHELEAILQRSRNASFSPPELLQRLEQFRREHGEIVPAAGDALERGDVAAFGDLVDESQRLANDLLGNQTPETMFLAAEARRLGAAAASAFGAGFGGAVWAMVERQGVGGFLARWSESYRRRFPDRAAHAVFLWSAAHGGVAEI